VSSIRPGAQSILKTAIPGATEGGGLTHLPVLAILALGGLSASVTAKDLTWRKDIQPLIKENCGACHGASAPSYEEWNLSRWEARANVPITKERLDKIKAKY